MRKFFFSALSAAIVVASFASCDRCTKDDNGEQLPIMAWYSIPPEEFTDARFKELADCGINVNFSHIYNLELVQKELDLGQKYGVKIMAMCNELYFQTDSAVNVIKDHPALFGYFLRDEPLPPAFPELAEWAQRIKEADSTHMIYLNLFPSYVDTAALGCTYREYVHRFIEEVKLPMVSFDNYPVTTEGVRQLWYDNLQVVADESRMAGLPFWAFSLSTPHWCYPQPTMASIRMQMYTNLAYGASGLQYFTYWNPESSDPFGYHDAPIGLDLKPSVNYEYVKAVNRELQARAWVFVGSNVVSLAHTGAVVPPGCPALTEMPAHVKSLTTSDEGAVVSLLEKGKYNYLVVVSRSLDKPIELNVEFDEKASMIDREGNPVKLAKGQTSFTIEDGDVAIFQFRK